MAERPKNLQQSLGVVIDSLWALWKSFLEHLPALVAGIVVFLLTLGLAKLIDFALQKSLKKRRFKRGFKDLFRQLVAVCVWIVGLMITAIVIFPGMTPAKALAGLGIGSLAIGFAFKDVVENFLAGILILWRFPFDPGDFIRCGEVAGRVEEITIRMTLILRTDGELVVLPNATLLKEPVMVLTHKQTRRVTIICGVGYGENVDEAREVIRSALKQCDSIHKDKPIEIFAQEFASSSINYEVTWWCGATPLEERRSRDQVVAAVKAALDAADIEIPFPYRTLTWKAPMEVRTLEQHSESIGEEK